MILRIGIIFFFTLLGFKNEITSVSIFQKETEQTSLINSDVEKTKGKTWQGNASFYHNKFQGKKTANGEIFDQNKMTCANNFLPLGTQLKVTNLSNGKTIYVKVNDRLAKSNKRLVDLSYSAAAKLGFIDKGIQKVEIELLNKKVLKEYVEPVRPIEPIISDVEEKEVEMMKASLPKKKKIKKQPKIKQESKDDSLDLSKYNYIKK